MTICSNYLNVAIESLVLALIEKGRDEDPRLGICGKILALK